MLSAVIWGMGYTYNRYINAIKYQELLGSIKISGITGREDIYEFLDGYPFIPYKEINPMNTDYVIVTSDIYYSEISATARSLGFSEESIIKADIFLYPGFDFEKYAMLLRRHVSIIANNCWGGTTYHTLRMKFLSPFINMCLSDDNYFRLLQNLHYYMDCKLKLDRYDLKQNYPVCSLGGEIELHFNHYADMEEVEQKWYSRCKRINWEDLFIMMWTVSEESAEQFSKLDFPRKICFVPFESNLKSVYTLRLAKLSQMKDVPFWQIVNNISQLIYSDYDLIELLSDGEIKNNRYAK